MKVHIYEGAEPFKYKGTVISAGDVCLLGDDEIALMKRLGRKWSAKKGRPSEKTNLSSLLVSDLKELCEENGLSASGKKSVLVERLQDFFDSSEDGDDDDDDDDDLDDEDDDEDDDDDDDVE